MSNEVKLLEKKYGCWLLVFLLVTSGLAAQKDMREAGDSSIITVDEPKASFSEPPSATADSLFTIREIIIVGNKRTRADIMLRELPFGPGDRYPLQEIVKRFETARRQLMNTTLFHEVVVALKTFEGYNIDILVQVKERWYIFPVPYFKPVDRNLNQWIVEQKASLSRVNYGLKLMYNNVTGRNDKLRLYAITGYTKQFSFSYDRLYIDKKLKWGMNVSMNLGKNRELNYDTKGDKQAFIKREDYQKNFFNSNIELTYRRAINTRHRFGIGFTSERVSDSIIHYNPNYFKEGRNKVQFPEIYYAMTYYNVDYIPYPTKGYVADLNVGKRGFNNAMNMWYLNAKGLGAWHTSPRSFFSLTMGMSLKLPFKQPYYNTRILGYGDSFMQGYEYYVMDGVAGGYMKATFGRKILDFKVRIPGFKKLAPRDVPFKIYAKVFGNTGYVYNPLPGDNRLLNKMLFSSGFGIDVFSIYDFTLKIEWSFNQIGENGLYLHRKTLF